MIASKYGYKQDGSVRKRPLRSVEFAIFDMEAKDVPDTHPEHVLWQRIMRRRCEEIQAHWSETEYERRRCDKIEPMTFEPMG